VVNAEAVLGKGLSREYRLSELLARPDVSYHSLFELLPGLEAVADPQVVEQVEVQAKYAGYIERQHEEIERARRNEDTVLGDAIDYGSVRGLSNEVREKLQRTRPTTIGQASRIPGVTPAAISLLMVYLKKHGGGKNTDQQEGSTNV
jgi:tRNA uridine 5-carboxymethylaminomethyl modification enzyme